MGFTPKIGKYYEKDDTNQIIIMSYKADKYDIKYFHAKRRFEIYTGNEVCGFTFFTRRYNLSQARDVVRKYLM